MTSDAIQQLTRIVGSPLPNDYIQLLSNYPNVLRKAMRALDDSDSEGSVADVELLENIGCVLALNLEARDESVAEPEGLEFFWPDQLLIIGETGAGDYYCIDVEGQEEGVIQFDHQSVAFEVIADSLDEFIEILEETFSESASDYECD